jgi:hypothetical protein
MWAGCRLRPYHATRTQCCGDSGREWRRTHEARGRLKLRFHRRGTNFEMEPTSYPRAPIGKKRIWSMRARFNPIIMISFDRQGKIWKQWEGGSDYYERKPGMKWIEGTQIILSAGHTFMRIISRATACRASTMRRRCPAGIMLPSTTRACSTISARWRPLSALRSEISPNRPLSRKLGNPIWRLISNSRVNSNLHTRLHNVCSGSEGPP